MGRGVRKINNKNEAYDFVKPLHEEIILQKYFNIEYDMRILVIGGKAIGGLKRYKVEGEEFLTTRPGGYRESFIVPEKLAKACIEATQLHGLEIAGVDAFYVDNKIYIIEVNASPQFFVFEKYTKINVAKKILEYTYLKK